MMIDRLLTCDVKLYFNDSADVLVHMIQSAAVGVGLSVTGEGHLWGSGITLYQLGSLLQMLDVMGSCDGQAGSLSGVEVVYKAIYQET